MTTEIVRGETARRRLEAMSRLFTKSDSVLAGKHITVKVYDKPNNVPAPSWTDGKTITFNKALIGDVTDVEDIIRVTGLNYHELAHVLYTPRPDRPMVQVVQTEGMFNAFNLLEDQRIETFLTAQYPSTIPYLVSTFMRFCLMHEQSWGSNFSLMYGRRYLPRDVRAEFRRRFKRPDLIPAFEEVIDRYRKLVFPADEAEGLTLIRDYHTLLQEMARTNNNPIDVHGHCDDRRPNVSEGKPVPQSQQQEASDNSDAFDDAFDADDTDDDDDATPQGDDNGGGNSDQQQDGDVAQDSPDFGDGGADSDSDDADDNGSASGDNSTDGDTTSASDQQTDGSGKGSDGGGKTGQPDLPQPTMPDADLRDMMDDIAKAFEEMPEVQEEVSNAQKTIVQGDGDVSSGFDAQGRFREFDTATDDAQAVRAFSRQLERLRADADPGWNTHQQSGRLNVKRVIAGAAPNELFDRWDEGYGEVADIECVVLIDTSGSMRQRIDRASRAMWTIKRALETIDASVTVFGYDSSTVKVYDRHEKAKPGKYKGLGTQGWTKPRDAIKEALHILTTSQRANRIFIIITDGQWDHEDINADNPHSADDLIALMNGKNITTALAHISPWGDSYGMEPHNCKVATPVASAADLVGFAKQIVTQTMKKG